MQVRQFSSEVLHNLVGLFLEPYLCGVKIGCRERLQSG